MARMERNGYQWPSPAASASLEIGLANKPDRARAIPLGMGILQDSTGLGQRMLTHTRPSGSLPVFRLLSSFEMLVGTGVGQLACPGSVRTLAYRNGCTPER